MNRWISALCAKECSNKSPFPFHELKDSNHTRRIATTLEAVFNRKNSNFTVLEGHSCRNATETLFWYHVILEGDDTRSEVSYIEFVNGKKRGRVDYLVLDNGKSHYEYRWKIAPIKWDVKWISQHWNCGRMWSSFFLVEETSPALHNGSFRSFWLLINRIPTLIVWMYDSGTHESTASKEPVRYLVLK